MTDMSMGDEQRHLVIRTSGPRATLVVDDVDLSNRVAGYQVEHHAGQAPMVVLFPKLGTDVDFDGMATVAVASQTPPGEAIAEFLGSIDPDALARAALGRDLDGSKNELTRAMLEQLAEWARGQAGG